MIKYYHILDLDKVAYVDVGERGIEDFGLFRNGAFSALADEETPENRDDYILYLIDAMG